MTRPCDQLGICQSRACGQCGRWPADAGPTLPVGADDEAAPMTRGERAACVATSAAWALVLVVTLTLMARACGGAA